MLVVMQTMVTAVIFLWEHNPQQSLRVSPFYVYCPFAHDREVALQVPFLLRLLGGLLGRWKLERGLMYGNVGHTGNLTHFHIQKADTCIAEFWCERGGCDTVSSEEETGWIWHSCKDCVAVDEVG